MNKKSLPTSAVQLLEIGEGQHGQRIDNFLIKTLKNLPRSRLYRIIRKGEVRVNKKRIRPEYKLQSGDVVRIPPLRLEQDDSEPVAIPDRLVAQISQSVIFENANILVLNKPSGLAVHSGSGVRYGVIDVMRTLRPDTDIELVHRLDRDTSGCLLLAKNRSALLEMQRVLQSGEMIKRYHAIVRGHWERTITRIELPLKRTTMSNGEKKVFVDENGQSAETRISRVEHYSIDDVDFSRLSIRLMSGRTHQIRVHCQSQHHEVAGDTKYGDRSFNKKMKQFGGKRLLLHAAELEIPRNAHTKAIKIHSPEPEEFRILTQDER